MSTLFEEIAKDSRIEGKAEGRMETNIETAREMIKDNQPTEKIMRYLKLSKELILKLQKQEKWDSGSKERLQVSTLFNQVAEDSKIEGKIEGKTEANIETVREMIKGNEPIDKILKYTMLSEEMILELQDQEELDRGREEQLKMSILFEEIVKDGRIEGRTEATIETAKRMLKRGRLSVEEIAEDTNLPIETVLNLQKHEEV